MYALRLRNSTCSAVAASSSYASCARTAAASLFLSHSSSHLHALSTAKLTAASSSTCALHSVRRIHSHSSSASDFASTSAAPRNNKPRRRSFGLGQSHSQRRKEHEEREQAEEDITARMDEAIRTAEEDLAAQESQERVADAVEDEAMLDEFKEELDSPTTLTPEISAAQIRGILAKRAALQAMYPLKKLLTSPRSGDEKIRIVPPTLQRGIDAILREVDYKQGQDSVYEKQQYGLWHVANRAATEYAVLARVASEVVKRLPSLDPESIMDYGSAASMGIVAWNEAVQKYGIRSESTGKLETPIRRYRTYESNTDLAAYGTKLTSDIVQTENIQVEYRANLPNLPSPSSPPLELASVVLAPFSLGLVSQTKEREKILDVLWSSVAARGVLVLIEAGTIDAFQLVRESREYLLDKYGMRSVTQRVQPGAEQIAANVLAPCGGNGVCPLVDRSLKRSCWHRAELLTSSLPIRTPQKHLRSKDGVTVETFSYVVLHKGPIRTSERDALNALKKWQPKDKDLNEIGQQGWQAIAKQQADDLLEKAGLTADAAAMKDAEPVTVEELAEAVPFYPYREDGSGPQPVSNSSTFMTTPLSALPRPDEPHAEEQVGPITKRADLSPLAHLLPSTTSPRNMFEHAYSRILRKPLRRGEHVVLDLCNEEQVLERRIIPKSWGTPYTLARQVNEGDLWPIKKRGRDPNRPMTPMERRKAEFLERKAKREASYQELDEEEALKKRQELNKMKSEEKKIRKEEKKLKSLDKRDAAIVARGGTPPVRKDPIAPEPEQTKSNHEVIFMEEEDYDDTARSELQKLRVEDLPEVVIPPPKVKSQEPKPKKEKKAKEARDTTKETKVTSTETATGDVQQPSEITIQAESNVDTRLESSPVTPATNPAAAESTATDAASPAETLSTKSTTPLVKPAKEKAAAKPAAKAKKPAAVDPANAPSRMPVWMELIMAKTKKAAGGGLEYTGALNQRPRDKDRPDEDDDDEEEYDFPADPTIALADSATTWTHSTQSPQELERLKRIEIEKEIAKKLSEKEQLIASPLNKKRKDLVPDESDATASVAATPKVKKPVVKKPKVERPATVDSAAEKKMKPVPNANAPATPKPVVPRAAASTASPAASQPPSASTPTDAPPAPHTNFFADDAPSTNSTAAPSASTSSSSASSSSSATPSSQPSGARLPAWARYRKIKQVDATPATPENTQIWPMGSKDALRNLYPDFHPAATSTATPTIESPSSLPPHLQALRHDALQSPRNSSLPQTAERTRQLRDKLQAAASSRHAGREQKRAERNQKKKAFSSRNKTIAKSAH